MADKSTIEEKESYALAKDNSNNNNNKTTDDQINIVVASGNGTRVVFKIKNTTPLQKMMEAYCNRQGLDPKSIRFLFNGTRVLDENTAKELEIENEDVIDAMVEQTVSKIKRLFLFILLYFFLHIIFI